MQPDLSRVAVVGASCAGKSTLAREMAQRLACPHIELDALYWQAGWHPREPEDFRARVRDAVAQERWVADGNYCSVRGLIWPRATAVVWLNYGFARVFWRGLKRTAWRALSGETLYADSRETVRQAFFSRDSMIWWVATSFHERRRENRAIFDGGDFPHIDKIELRRPAEARRFLRAVK